MDLQGNTMLPNWFTSVFRDIGALLQRKKRIKGGSRSKKVELISRMNSTWKDLYYSL